MSDWEVVPDKKSEWEVVPSKPLPSKTESALRGLAQGATLGYSDELTGLIESALSDKSYRQSRDEARANNEAAKKANPLTYGGTEIGGGVASAIAAGPASLGAKGALALGATMGLGNSEADLTEGDIKGAAIDTGIGAGLGLAGQQAGKWIGKKLSPIGEYLSKKFGSKAESLAEAATGATGREAEKFAPGAGRELLDRKIVRPFSSPADIAKNATKAQMAADSEIGSTLSKLDADGVTASSDDILAKINSRIALLDENPANANTVRQLETIKADIVKSLNNGSKPLSEIEGWKRAYNNNKRLNWNNHESANANKEAYLAMRDVTEDLATAHDPNLAEKFIEAKKTHGLLNPIIDAAERRTSQLNQHPILGLNDVAAAASGAFAGDPTFGAGTAMARRVIAPRIASTAATGLDAASKMLKANPAQSLTSKIPQIGSISANQANPTVILQKVAGSQYEKPLQDAIARGNDSFSETYFLLQQRDPNFRKKMSPNGYQ